MAASASSTSSKTRSYGDFITSCKSRERFKRVPKQPGSKKLIHGDWVTVTPDDDDAITEDA
jgi:hypothetical protein